MENFTDKRQLLRKDDVLSLTGINVKTGDPAGGVTEFKIMGTIGAGGSSVCYEAECVTDGTVGRLKELYPMENESIRQFFHLRRDERNDLFIPHSLEGVHGDFLRVRDGVLQAYCTLARVMNSSRSVLPNYISPFEIYESFPEDGIGTVYVWTQHDRAVISFDSYIEKMQEPISRGESHALYLFTVVDAVLSLTRCISALHAADLWHLDIKPGNFGMCLEESGTPMSSNIYLFDVNTIFPAGNDSLRTAGSDGFRAKEILSGKASCRSDIYSIGATLFCAAVSRDGESLCYRDGFYRDIPEIVGESELFRGDSRLAGAAAALAEIFRGCLHASPRMRYRNCTELIEDLRRVRLMLLPMYAEDAGGGFGIM